MKTTITTTECLAVTRVREGRSSRTAPCLMSLSDALMNPSAGQRSVNTWFRCLHTWFRCLQRTKNHMCTCSHTCWARVEPKQHVDKSPCSVGYERSGVYGETDRPIKRTPRNCVSKEIEPRFLDCGTLQRWLRSCLATCGWERFWRISSLVFFGRTTYSSQGF